MEQEQEQKQDVDDDDRIVENGSFDGTAWMTGLYNIRGEWCFDCASENKPPENGVPSTGDEEKKYPRAGRRQTVYPCAERSDDDRAGSRHG